MRFDAAVAGLVLAVAGVQPALLLAAPYLRDRVSEVQSYRSGPRLKLLSGRLAEDAVSLGALMAGTISARTLVI